jgi:hypothetical protein
MQQGKVKKAVLHECTSFQDTYFEGHYLLEYGAV